MEKKAEGIRIKGRFVEEEKQAVYKKSIYKKLIKTKPCGFHQVAIENLRVQAGSTTIFGKRVLKYCLWRPYGYYR